MDNLEKLATQNTQDDNPQKLATQNTQDDNPEKLATQNTQDEDKQNKNTTQYVLTPLCTTNTNNINKT